MSLSDNEMDIVVMLFVLCIPLMALLLSFLTTKRG